MLRLWKSRGPRSKLPQEIELDRMSAYCFEPELEIAGIGPRGIGRREKFIAAADPHAGIQPDPDPGEDLAGENPRGFAAADGRVRRRGQVPRVEDGDRPAATGAEKRDHPAVRRRERDHRVGHEGNVEIARTIEGEEVDMV